MLVAQICHDIPVLLERRQTKYKEFYDRQGSKQLPLLKEGDSVRFKKPGDKHLSPAVVKGKHETPKPYFITDETGREYRRNRRHIHLTQEPPVTVNDDLSDESESVTIQANVNLPSGVTTESDDGITAESDANSELNPPDNNVFSGLRCSTRVRSVPSWHKDYVM